MRFRLRCARQLLRQTRIKPIFVTLLVALTWVPTLFAQPRPPLEEEAPAQLRLPYTPPRTTIAEPDPVAPPELSQEGDYRSYPNRWEITPPPYEMNVRGSRWDPYNQNRLKGDFPIAGDDRFLNLTASYDLLLEYRTVPTPSGASAERPESVGFFGRDGQFFSNQNLSFSVDLFKGDTAYRPIDWRVKTTVVANDNRLIVEERGGVNVNVQEGTRRARQRLAFQELFAEVKLADFSPNYDFVSLRAGIQPFQSDFRGFIFTDSNFGVRLFGTLHSNRDQFNLAFFDPLEKETNSGLNTLTRRNRKIGVVNFYRQDFLVKGYTTQVSAHYLRDEATLHFDRNGFLARPDPVGIAKPHTTEVSYLGWTGEGHIHKMNITHAFYKALGEDGTNLMANRPVDIRATMAALEVSADHDWWRPRLAYFYASGDEDPTDSVAEGFDAIFDNPAFAGGGNSYWNRLGLRLAGTGVALVNRGSLLPDLKSSKEEGQPNFVNPGLHLVSAGLDLELTPKFRAMFNVNALRFDRTETFNLLLFQSNIDKKIGWDLSAGCKYRPFLNNNVILQAGVAMFLPNTGFAAIYESDRPLYLGWTQMTLTF